MNQNTQVLFKAIQATLNKTPFSQSFEDEKGFFILAKENGVSGMLYQTLKDSKLSDLTRNHFYKDYLVYHKSDFQQLDVISSVKAILNDQKIPHIFLKGTQLKELYPESYMRSMGDIDVLVNEKDHKKARKLLLNTEFKLLSDTEQHTSLEHLSGIHIELHPRLSYVFNDKHAKFLTNVWEHTKKQENDTFIFEPEFELVYLLYHMAKHFHGTGVGLRTVLDIGIYAQHYEKEINLTKLKHLLEESELLTFFQTMLELNKAYFNIEVFKESFQTKILDEATFEQLTNYILLTGVHGHGHQSNPFASRLGASKVKGQSRLRFILKLTFPSYNSMKGMYPWLKYVPFLYPLTWGIRWIRLVFKKTRSTLYKTKQLFIKKDHVNEVANLYKKIGL